MADASQIGAVALQVLERAGDGIAILDERLVYLYANPAAERLLGMSREELLGRSQWELFPSTAGTPLESILRSAQAGHPEVSLERYFELWGRCEVTAAPAAGGGVTVRFRRCAAAQSYAEQEAAQEVAAAAGAGAGPAPAAHEIPDLDGLWPKLALEASNDGIVLHELVSETSRGCFLELNGAICRMLGYTREEMLRLTPLDIIEPAQLELVENERQVMLEGGNLLHEKVLLGKGGRRVPAEINTRLFKHRGRPLVLSVIRDISERLDQRARLRHFELLAAHSRDKILLIRAGDGRILEANAAAVKAYGYSREELLQLTVFDLRPEHLRAVARSQMEDADRRTILFETMHRRKDGSTFPVEVSSQGATVGGERLLISVVRDITERRQAEEEVRRSQADLNRAQAVGQIGSWRLDVRRNELTWSDEAHRIFEIPRGVPLTYETFLGLIHPEDRDTVDTAWKARLRGAPYDVEHRIVVPSGVKWIRERAELEFDSDGQLLGGFGTSQDITARRQAEAQLAEAKERQELLAEVVSRLLAADDPRQIVQDLAEKVMRKLECDAFFNYLAEPGGGRLCLNAWAGIPEELAERWKWLEYGSAVCGCVAQSGSRMVVESIQSGADPRTTLVRSVGIQAYACHPLLAGGEVIGTLSFGSRSRPRFSDHDLELMQTVTNHIAIAMERVRAQRSLQESEERFRRMAVSLPQLVWTCRPDGPCDYLSPQWVDYTGIPESEQLGYGWLQQLHQDDRERVMAEWQKSAPSGADFDTDFRIRRHDGVYRWFKTRATLVRDAEGRPLRWFGSNTDVHDRLEAEERIRQQNAVLAGINGIFHGALSCDTEEALGAACLAVAEQITGSRFGFLAELDSEGQFRTVAVSGQDACDGDGNAGPVSLALLERCGRAIRTGSSWIAGPPGETGAPSAGLEPNSLMCVPLRLGATITGVLGLANREGGYRRQDLDAAEALAPAIVEVFTRKRLEHAARAGEERLRQAQKMETIGLLAGGVAHDFNNLLAVILGNASLLREEVPPEGWSKLDSVVRATERAADLTRQLLAYAGKGRYVVEPLDLSQTIRGMSTLLEAAVPKKVELRVNLAWGLPAIEADRGQLQQVVLNLVTNGAEAIGQSSSGTISVNTSLREIQPGQVQDAHTRAPLAPGIYLCLEVSDSGSGMDASTRARIFEPFFTTKFMGRGLGLAAVAGIVQAHQGAIEVESQPGAGATFRVYLPAHTGLGGLSEAVQPVHAARRRKILAVDDESMVLQFVQSALERMGCDVLLARNGKEALELHESHGSDIDLVLLDLIMPVMAGDEAAAALHRARPELPLVVMSGYGEAETLRRFEGQSVSGFLRKPFTAARLVEEVTGALKRESGSAPGAAR